MKIEKQVYAVIDSTTPGKDFRYFSTSKELAIDKLNSMEEVKIGYVAKLDVTIVYSKGVYHE